MQSEHGHGIMLTVMDGYLVCPRCRVNRKVMRILPTTNATNLQVFCRSCKAEYLIDIVKGQCFESRSR